MAMEEEKTVTDERMLVDLDEILFFFSFLFFFGNFWSWIFRVLGWFIYCVLVQVMVPPHPLIKHWISVLRNEQTPCAIFSKLDL